jgi:hypothetical protein
VIKLAFLAVTSIPEYNEANFNVFNDNIKVKSKAIPVTGRGGL